jgi:hypothetical protein
MRDSGVALLYLFIAPKIGLLDTYLNITRQSVAAASMNWNAQNPTA